MLDAVPCSTAPRDPKELLEAVLGCVACGARYPIVCGVLVLVGDVDEYLALRGAMIEEAVDEFRVSSAMRRLLRGSDTSRRPAPGRRGDHARVNHDSYVCSHYDRLGDVEPGPHPLQPLFRLQDGHDLWSAIDRQLAGRRLRDALDIGCSVGGMVRRMARHASRVVGIDLMFPSVLVARRILLGHPAPLTTYTDRRECQDGRPRVIDPGPIEADVELFVASALEQPLRGGFDLVSALNVIDVVAEPLAALRQLMRSVQPDGHLLLTSPYCWDMGPAPADRWLGGREGRASDEAVRQALVNGGFTVEWEADALPWIMRNFSRAFQVNLVHAVLARR